MPNILILGAAGFIGTNLTVSLAQDKQNNITVVDKSIAYFEPILSMNLEYVTVKESDFDESTDFDNILVNQDIVYHLISTTVPTTSNRQVSQELTANVVMTAKLLDACVRCRVKKMVFISSGGTVYGNVVECPIKEDTLTNPISSYGIQKVAIEKLLYLYYHMYGLDYRIIRLANPYGPYQRPNGILGAVTTFTYKAIIGEKIIVYGDGSIIRDFIYIDDAIKGILNIVYGDEKYKIFNLGCGYGTSINELLSAIKISLCIDFDVTYRAGRTVDVPINYLDINRYEMVYGKLEPIDLVSGIKKTADFILKWYRL